MISFSVYVCMLCRMLSDMSGPVCVLSHITGWMLHKGKKGEQAGTELDQAQLQTKTNL